MQRFQSAESTCPICGGYERARRGQGARCYGYRSSDGDYAHCTRPEFAGGMPPHQGQHGGETYAHRLRGRCHCGSQHGADVHDFDQEKRQRIVATYDYTDESGKLIYQVVRLDSPKSFRQRRPDGRGGWEWNLQGVQPLLFRLPQLIRAVHAGDAIYIAEGEKDVLALERVEVAATCNSGGAAKFPPSMARYFDGADVVIIRDKDEPGTRHARDVLAKIGSVAKAVRVVEALTGHDAHDHLAAGHRVDEFVPVTLEEHAAPSSTPAVENLTELGLTRRLVRLHGEDLHYIHPWRRWLVWDARRWAEDSTAEVMRRVKATVQGIYAEAAAATESDERRELAQFASRCETARRLVAAVELAASEPGIPILPEQLDADPWLLNVANGTLDLRTAVLRPHARRDLLTRIAPTPYDPTAAAPRWHDFLERILPDAETRAFVQRYAGYSLTGLVSEQVLVMLFGSGANGKSTFIEALRSALGDYAQHAPADTILAKRDTGIPNDVARLRGARFVSIVETEEGRRLAEAQVKMLTGGDTIVARFMRGEWFEFRPTAKYWLASNHRPRIRGTDFAIWRRIRLVPFMVQIPEAERDPDLLMHLREELPGILRWAVEGCAAWQLEGLRAPNSIQSATEEYRAHEDVLRAWIEERCILSVHAQYETSALYAGYRTWCEQAGERPLEMRSFVDRLTERGHAIHRGAKGRRYRLGIALAERNRVTGDAE